MGRGKGGGRSFGALRSPGERVGDISCVTWREELNNEMLYILVQRDRLQFSIVSQLHISIETLMDMSCNDFHSRPSVFVDRCLIHFTF